MKFIVLGQNSAITYKDVFPLIKGRRVRIGAGPRGQIAWFGSPYEDMAAASGHKPGLIRVAGVRWFTNLRHDVRRSLPPLKTMAENLATNKRLRKHLLEKYGRLEYPRYDNYAAIEVPFVDAIPSDYNGVMGVPVTFLDKWDPDEGTYRPRDLRASGREVLYAGTRREFARLLIQPRHELVWQASGNTMRNTSPDMLAALGFDASVGYGSMPANGTAVIAGSGVYSRLLIRPAGA